MGSIAIIDLGHGVDRNAAPVQTYGDLYHALGGNNGQQNLTNRTIIINGGGEAVGYSRQTNTLWTPETVAGHIKRDGLVWVDYCGFPFYYQGSPGGTAQTLGQSGWRQFASFLGYGWLANVSFFVNITEGFNPLSSHKAYQIARGFPLNESLDGVCYCPTCTYTIPGGFLGIGGLNGVVTADGYTGMMALHPPGGGYYFYAAWTPEYILLRDNKAAQGIPITTYASFIQQVLTGQTSGLQCNPYQIAVQHTHRISPGPTSPIKIVTERTVTHSTPHQTVSSASSAKTSPLAEELLAGSLLLGGLGLGVIVWIRRQEGHQ